jgi:hypothetical protein
MNSFLLQNFTRRVSIVILVLGILLCAIFFFDRNVELGTLVYFYVCAVSVVYLLLLIIILFQCFIDRTNWKRLFTTAFFVIVNCCLLLLASWFVLEYLIVQ